VSGPCRSGRLSGIPPLLVVGLILQQRIDDRQDLMPDRHQSLLRAQALGPATVHRLEDCLLAMWPAPWVASQSDSSNRSAVIVPKVRTCSWTWPSGPLRNTQATTVVLCTSNPAQQGWRICMAAPRDQVAGPRDDLEAKEQFALRAPQAHGVGRGRQGWVRYESSRGRTRFVLGLNAPKTRRPQSRGQVPARIVPFGPIFMELGVPWVMKIRSARRGDPSPAIPDHAPSWPSPGRLGSGRAWGSGIT
jgi:hypothetical protein